MKKQDYRSKKEIFFIDHLPKEVFDNLSVNEKKHYQRYRNHHRFIFDGKQKIEKLEDEIKKMKDEIKSKKVQIKGDENTDGWERIMKDSYSQISSLSKKFEFYTSIGFRNRKSKSVSNKTKFNKSEIRNQSKFRGKELSDNPKLYLRIDSIDKFYRQNIYVGSEENVRGFLNRVTDEDWSKRPISTVKWGVIEKYKPYIRYHIYHSNWEKFIGSTHSLSIVEEWVNKIGDTIKEWE